MGRLIHQHPLITPILKVEYSTFLHCKFILFQPYGWGVIRGCWYLKLFFLYKYVEYGVYPPPLTTLLYIIGVLTFK